MKQISTIPQLGTTSADVGVIEQALNDLAASTGNPNFNCGEVDNIWGRKVNKAMIAVQQELDPKTEGTGIPGPITLKKLGIEVVAAHPISGAATVTQDLKGKQDRHLHPNTRVLLEKKLWPNGEVSANWQNADIPECYKEVAFALASLGWHENGINNHGTEVGWIQATTGSYTEGGNGDAWCLDYAQIIFAIIEDYFKVESPVWGGAHCMTCWDDAKGKPGLTTQEATAGALALGRHGSTSDGHAMPCVAVYENGTMETSEGNTSIANMTDGDGSGLKVRNQHKNGDLVTQGWVYTYPNNKLPGHA